MKKKIYLNNSNSQESASAVLSSGIKKLAEAVKSTLGPCGRNVLISSDGYVSITKDGVTVANSISFSDPAEQAASILIKDCANKTVKSAGDGTTTATILAEAIYNTGLSVIQETNAKNIQIKNGIDKAYSDAVEVINNISTPCDTQETLQSVATISANNDRELGVLVAEAVHMAGTDGTVVCEQSPTIETVINKVDGMQLARGFLSSYFCQAGTAKIDLKEPYILIYDGTLGSVKPILHLLQGVAAQKKPLLIIADEIVPEALATLVYNSQKGLIECCAIKAPAFGVERKEILNDIAALTGGTYITEDLGLKLESTSIDNLGKAKSIRIDKNSTTIIDGQGDKKAIADRIESINKQLEGTTHEHELIVLKRRKAKLTGGVVTIAIGGVSEVEIFEKKDRIDDAIAASTAALESGILPGGGVSLLYLQSQLKEKVKDITDAKLIAGYNVFISALDAPFKTLCDNAAIVETDDGIEALIADIAKGTNATEHVFAGYDMLNQEYVDDMMKENIIDPTKVCLVSLEAAKSIAGMLLSTSCIIVDDPDQVNTVMMLPPQQ